MTAVGLSSLSSLLYIILSIFCATLQASYNVCEWTRRTLSRHAIRWVIPALLFGQRRRRKKDPIILMKIKGITMRYAWHG